MAAKPSCPLNIGKAQKRLRLILGILLFILAAAASVLLVFSETQGWIRGAVFIPYFFAMLCFLQAKERTCVIFAYQKVQDLGAGLEPVTDPEASSFLKIKAQKLVMQAGFIAILLTAATFLIR
jgi:hypothetical protein